MSCDMSRTRMFASMNQDTMKMIISVGGFGRLKEEQSFVLGRDGRYGTPFHRVCRSGRGHEEQTRSESCEVTSAR